MHATPGTCLASLSQPSSSVPSVELLCKKMYVYITTYYNYILYTVYLRLALSCLRAPLAYFSSFSVVSTGIHTATTICYSFTYHNLSTELQFETARYPVRWVIKLDKCSHWHIGINVSPNNPY